MFATANAYDQALGIWRQGWGSPRTARAAPSALSRKSITLNQWIPVDLGMKTRTEVFCEINMLRHNNYTSIIFQKNFWGRPSAPNLSGNATRHGAGQGSAPPNRTGDECGGTTTRRGRRRGIEPRISPHSSAEEFGVGGFPRPPAEPASAGGGQDLDASVASAGFRKNEGD